MSAAATGRVIGRFAPSPTGPLHAGSLVSAVGSWLLARQGGGKWLLRMEDLDTPRVVPGMADDILRTLEAFALHWDDGIVWQSRRTEAYREALSRLQQLGLAYPCGCSRAEIARVATAPHGREEQIYPGTCRNGLPPGKSERAVRVRVDDAEISFHDGIVGECSERLAETCGDFVVKRSDGLYAYQLAVVVDDADAGVNQVARGADLLASTPRQIYLQRLLGYPVPDYFHIPLVTGPGGEKLSKRDTAISLAQGGDLSRRAPGLLCRALHFLGQTVPADAAKLACFEILDYALATFSPQRIPLEPSPFPEIFAINKDTGKKTG